ncbi:MAG: CheY-like chemotaxis protein [Flavobacteriales bacterium]|jgi:CheY-like chemotaxis protein
MKTIVEMQPINRELNIYLAEDDEADCLLFKEAIDELPVKVKLTIVRDGQQLVELLTQEVNTLPDVLFLDLNMPRKNGFAALGQIKRNEKLLNLPVIVLSTANDETKVKMVFKDAAHYYIRKPAKFIELKEVLYKAIKLIAEGNLDLPKQENFLITVEAKSKLDESNPS